MAATLEEMHAVLDDVRRVYAEDMDDLRLVSDIRRNQHDLIEACQNKEQRLQQRLEELQGQVRVLREKSQAQISTDMILQERELLERQKGLHEQIVQLEEDVGFQKNKVASVNMNLEHLNERYESLSQQSSKEIPAYQKTLKLFKKIAPIMWEYDTPQPRDVIGSYVSAQSNRIVRIKIPAEAGKSDFEIANSLWDMMARESEEPATTKSVTLIR